MKTAALLMALATLTVSGCNGYTPSKANCFSFVARGPSDSDCTFTQLGSADMALTPVSDAALSDPLYD